MPASQNFFPSHKNSIKEIHSLTCLQFSSLDIGMPIGDDDCMKTIIAHLSNHFLQPKLDHEGHGYIRQGKPRNPQDGNMVSALCKKPFIKGQASTLWLIKAYLYSSLSVPLHQAQIEKAECVHCRSIAASGLLICHPGHPVLAVPCPSDPLSRLAQAPVLRCYIGLLMIMKMHVGFITSDDEGLHSRTGWPAFLVQRAETKF